MMRSRKGFLLGVSSTNLLVTSIVATLILSSAYTVSGPVGGSKRIEIEPRKKVSRREGPIRIHGQPDSRDVDFTGNGSWSNPYVVEDYVINGSDYEYTCIIENTRDYIIIRNCTFYNANFYGIKVINCTNVIFLNNEITDTGIGVYVYDSDNITIADNTIARNEDGIWFEDSCENNTIAGNKVSSNDQSGITLDMDNRRDVNNTLITLNVIKNNQYVAVEIINCDFRSNYIDAGVTYIYDNQLWNNTYSIIMGGKRVYTFPLNYYNYSSDQHFLDLDTDGLNNGEELFLGTDPFLSDTDNDNLLDGYEVKTGTDPLVDDTDGDGFLDGAEVREGHDPLDPDDYPGVSEYPDAVKLALITGAFIVAIIAPLILLYSKKKSFK
ncbi:MAG: right-handed parallel beta-helix repeat-containing protein [Candidatus Hodarchaeales archaeon]|jgi:parallel beta-helix repeat protein